MPVFLDDAELQTGSWQLRHCPSAIERLGVWRWRGMLDNMTRLLPLIVGRRVIDFGGHDAPVGFGALVVDRRGPLYSLDEIRGEAETVFTSHTLEHVVNLPGILDALADKLLPGGSLIVHVPAWTCTRWRAGDYSNPRQSDHRHTFALTTGERPEMPHRCIDLEVARVVKVTFAEYVGDNSILVIGAK